MLRGVLLLLSICFIAYNGPYLWWVEYRHIPSALANPLNGPIKAEYIKDTESAYRAYAFRTIGEFQIRDWSQTRGAIPVGELKSEDSTLSCIVTWKPKTNLSDVLSLGSPSGLLYHPGYFERRTLPELGTKFPVAILRIGTLEELKEFYRVHWRFRIIFIIVLSLFSLNALYQMIRQKRQ